MAKIKNLLFASFVLVLVAVSSQPSRAAEPNLQAAIRSQDPLKSVLVLTNNTGKACQVAGASTGTVAITRAEQGGKVIEPQNFEPFYEMGIESVIRSNLRTLKPGERAEINLNVLEMQRGLFLDTVTWSPDAGSYGLAYPLQSGKPLDLELTYNVPLSPETIQGAPLCPIAIVSSGASATKVPWLVWSGAVIVFLLLVAFVVMKLLRHKHRRAGTVAVIVFLSLVGVVIPPRTTRADFVPTADAPDLSQAANCMDLLYKYRDITGPVLDTANKTSVNIEVRYIDDIQTGVRDVSSFAQYKELRNKGINTYWLSWNPRDVISYEDGDAVSTPCSRLYHELYHVYEYENKIIDDGGCYENGVRLNIPANEVTAVRAQNHLNARMQQEAGHKLTPRTRHNKDEPLPKGNCDKPPSPLACQLGGCAVSSGDPHLKTFDRLKYDFMAAGEFVAAKSKNDDYEIQVRQAPWLKSRTVSMNTAIAMRLDSDKVEFNIQDRRLSLLVNGRRKPFETTKLDGGGSVTKVNSLWATVAWPDGSTVTVRLVGTFGLNVIFDPAPNRAGQLEGLLGNFNDDPDDDLHLRGQEETIAPDFDKLYPGFADSWRVSKESSLFTYEAGTSTETYTDRAFPDEPVDIQKLPNRAAAEAFCRRRGIVVPEVLKDCTLDMALTGQPEFAEAALFAQAATKNMDNAGQIWTATVKDPGSTASVEFDGKAGQKVFLDVPETTLPDQCNVLILTGPDGHSVGNNGCIVRGRGMIDATTLPADGTYKITVDPDGNNTGSIRLQLFSFHDQKGRITLGGSEVTAKIDQPGKIAQFTFDGRAGQRIHLELSSSGLPDQCDVVTLQSPSNARVNIGSGCIRDNKGQFSRGGAVLPATGTYTLTIDPGEAATGQAVVRVKK